MTRLSFLIPVFIILFAVGGAFAMKSANTANLQPVHYWVNNTPSSNPADCKQADVPEPCTGNDITCERFIEDEGALRDVFQDADCQTPYEMEEL